MAAIQRQKQIKPADSIAPKSKSRVPVRSEGDAELSSIDRKEALNRPQQASPETILRLQRLAGNNAVQRLLQREPSGDEDEVQAKPLSGSLGPALQREAAEEDDEVQTKRAAAGESFAPGEGFEARLDAQQGSGQPLPAVTREFMESRFGVDFGAVRLHGDSAAAQLNREVQAQAFTHGSDIYLGEGKSDLGSDQGKQLLAHELTHVVQQTGGVQRAASGRRLVVGAANDPAEQEADQMAEQVVQAGTLAPGSQTSGSRAAQGLVQAKLQGSYQALHDVSTHGRGWNNILKKLQEYERLEQEQLGKMAVLKRIRGQADLLKGASASPEHASFREQYRTVVEQMGKDQREVNAGKKHLLADLQALSKLITAWIDRGKHQRTAEQQKSSPQDITVQRRQALEMLLPRVMAEIYAINTNSFGESSVGGGQNATDVKFNAVGGALNKLDLITYQNGSQAFFKPEKPIDDEHRKLNPISEEMDFGHPGAETGIQEINPHFGARSVAMARLDALLNANMVVKTEFATLVRPDGSGGMKAKMGIAMEKARGQGVDKSIETGLATDLDSPVLLRGLSKLQMLDALCGQVDRHLGNYFIERNERGEVIGVKGIDNDLSFGAGITDASQKGSRQWKGQYRGLPPVIDEELGNTLLGISPEIIREALTGLLTQSEIEATLSRLTKLKEELRVLQRNGLFKAATARWSQEEITQMAGNSYFDTLEGATAADLENQCLSILLGKGLNQDRFHMEYKTGSRRLFKLLREKRIPSRDQALAVAELAAGAMVNNLTLSFSPTLDRFLKIKFNIDPLPVRSAPVPTLDQVD
jgi:hypothetical protein